MGPASPSRLVPGAWPASPSPSQRRCNSIGSPRLHQHIPNLSPPKITPRRVTRSHFTSQPILATSIADNTPTSFTSDLSLRSSPANTSISSAYMSLFLENSPSSPEQDKLLQYQNKIGRPRSLSRERGIGMYCESPSPPGDRTHYFLPEIPDLSSLSSQQEEFHVTRENFNVYVNEPSYPSLDGNMRGSSLGCGSFDTLSSSSIRFRPTEVPRLEWDTQALQVPQPNDYDRDSWTLFLSPVSASLGKRSSPPSQLTWTPCGVQMSELECHSAGPACINVRKSWMGGDNLPGPTDELPEEDASTRRYANEVLEHAFRMDADGSMFTLDVPGVDISPDVPPFKVVPNPQRRVKFSGIAKRLVHRIFHKPRMEGTILEHAINEDPESTRNSRHHWPKPQFRDSSVLLHGGTPGPSSQDMQGGPEWRISEFKLGGIRVRKRSAVSLTPGMRVHYPITSSLQHLSAFASERPKPHSAKSENQHCDISKVEKPKGNHRRSFLSRTGV